LGVQDRRDDLRRVHVQTDEGSSLRHGWFLQYAVVGRRAGATARLNITPTTVGGPARFYTAGRTTFNPYCLRQKLRTASPQWSYIHTHFGVGYRFAPEPVNGEGADPNAELAAIESREPAFDPALTA
ncbi:MAG: hypothetical protein ACR2GZ_09390, partial [Solirubrobacteraceae bacterium]